MTIDVTVERLAEDALLLRFGDRIDAAINARVHAATRALRAAALAGVVDIAPAYASLLVRFDPAMWIEATSTLPCERIAEQVRALVTTLPLPHAASSHGGEGRGEGAGISPVMRADSSIDIPVCYGDEFGPDLDAVAAHAGLSQDEVIARHTATEYTIAMLGFAPGFPYLTGLDPALNIPRRAAPRTRVPAGSVAIGGAQTGVYPRELPGGWHLIGRTPLVLFDPRRDPPALLAPGDRVRFRAIRNHEFDKLPERPSFENLVCPRSRTTASMSIDVVKPGLLTTLQDGGRPGYAHLGVGRSGTFDVPALRIANALAGNPHNACALELTLAGPMLRFRHPAWIALTGAPTTFRIDGADAPMWAPVRVAAGAVVEIGAMRSGCRGYLAVAGGFDAEPVLGSRSTDANAGLGPLPRALRAGDVLQVAAVRDERARPDNRATSTPRWSIDARPWFDDGPVRALRLLPGTHLENLDASSRKLLFSESFAVHADSNRVGIRLRGPQLQSTAPIEMTSEGCVPGVLQLPPSGQPIAFGPECPVSGGYPRIGQIAAVDLPRLAQRRPGNAVRFRPCTLDAALDALRKREQALTKLEAAIATRLQDAT